MLGKAQDARWEAGFDLAVMASSAFQCLVTDDDLRYPAAREWETWHGASYPVRDLEVSYDVERVEDGIVTFTEPVSRAGEVLRVDRGSLRFLEVAELNGFLADAGFAVEGQYGDRVRGPVTARTRSVVTVASAR